MLYTIHAFLVHYCHYFFFSSYCLVGSFCKPFHLSMLNYLSTRVLIYYFYTLPCCFSYSLPFLSVLDGFLFFLGQKVATSQPALLEYKNTMFNIIFLLITLGNRKITAKILSKLCLLCLVGLLLLLPLLLSILIKDQRNLVPSHKTNRNSV